MVFYAHTDPKLPGKSPDCPNVNWQPLDEHLQNVGQLCGDFADAFESKEWGRLAGLWHDLGKYLPEFQSRLRGEFIAVEHSGVGAYLAFDRFKNNGLPLSLVIAGHHSGLSNITTAQNGVRLISERLKENKTAYDKATPNIPQSLTDFTLPSYPEFLMSHCSQQAVERNQLLLDREMWIRFLFSCLIDADRLDTAKFCNPADEKKRGGYESIPELRRRCDEYIDNKIASLLPAERSSQLNQARAQILAQCREAAHQTRGAFSLTVPTGGGKTLSSMSFALRHAEHHGLSRVIVVIPYTSIIEQNAKEYGKCLGIENVLEHHSNLDLEEEAKEKGHDAAVRNRLAAENWDAPVIVTTSVQFFETLFASKPSKARKLHNIARSVVILDEVQTLPPEFLNSILDGLNQLIRHYGCSIVLSTATPPALAARAKFPQGLREIRPIILEPEPLFKNLKRVEITWPEKNEPPTAFGALADEIAKERQILCVVHRRQDARELAELLAVKCPVEGVQHLSALMCPRHRLKVIETIRQRLNLGETCRVVSTQLIEAGVDLDFPVVYRALGGLDSMVQAAGRCNREGRPTCGRVRIFRASSNPPPGVPRAALQVMESLLLELGNDINTNNPEIFDQYFRTLYTSRSLDGKNIQANRQQFDFATVGREFQLIEDGFTRTVIVPWGDAVERLNWLKHAQAAGNSTQNLIRYLQPFTVNIYQTSFNNLQRDGALEEIAEGLFALYRTHHYLYNDTYGLIVGDDIPQGDPSAYNV